MKNISKLILGVCCSASILMTGCIDETFPTNVATSDQLSSSAKATEALLWAMPAYTNKFNVFAVVPSNDAYAFDWGYGSIMHIRDVMTEDFAVISHGYDWYQAWEYNMQQGENYLRPQYIWNYYWKFVQTANNMIGTLEPETATDVQLGYLGAGYAFRAFIYLDMARMFEFLENDKTNAVNAAGNNVKGLTVPIVKEGMTEAEARNNPRATREQMAEFILDDLNKAEEYIAKLTATEKTLPHLDVVYGLKARYYMWLENYPEAKNYAEKAIAATSVRPMSQDAWLSTTKGFNDISAGMWGSQMQSEDDVVKSGILNWTAWMSNEAVYGYCGAGPFNMISSSLYNRINDTDFRKLAWKAPEGGALEGQNTYISEAQFEKIPDYGSLKFRPAEGNGDVSNIGSASAYPLMRVEEMYFIVAEAAAHQNAAEGKAQLESFMQTYRDANYVCSANDIIDEIILQKRIEFWGEGITFFDIKRLNMSVTRGYEGTNFADAARFNTNGRPAWMNICIVQTEKNNNSALVGYENPDPTALYDVWIDPNATE